MKTQKRNTLRLNSVLLCIALAAFCLAGCGGNKAADNNNAGTPAADPVKPADQGSTQPTESGAQGSAQGGEAPADGPVFTSEEYYNAFIYDGYTVSIDYDANHLPAGEYDASGLAHTVCDALTAETDGSWEYFLSEAYYAIIDCGNDGEPELALDLSYITADGYGQSYDKIYIIKNFDGDLRIIADDFSAYRGYTELNTLGFITSGGSSSASSWYDAYSFITADGERKFLYSAEYNFAKADTVIPDYMLPSGTVPEDYEYSWDFVEDGIEMDVYNFTEYDDSRWDDDDYYDEYLKGNIFVFLDSEENDIAPAEQYAQLYEDAGVQISTNAEVQARIAERAAELGCTEEIHSAEPVEWIELDSEVVDWLPKG